MRAVFVASRWTGRDKSSYKIRDDGKLMASPTLAKVILTEEMISAKRG